MSVALALTLLLTLISGSGGRPAPGAQPCGRDGQCRRLAQADVATPEVVTANAGHSESISGASHISPQAWAVPAGFRPVQHRVMRMVGRGVVKKRLQMEAGWRTYIEEDVETLGGRELATYRHVNFTEHPFSRPDLAALESVDEEVVLYVAPGADPLLFTSGNASARAAAEAGLVGRVHARGLDVQLVQLYVGPVLGSISPQRATRNTTIAATRSKLLVSGSGLVPSRMGLQTAVLLALQSAAARADLPLLSCNVTSWQLASAADASRLNLSASGLVEADVWMQTHDTSFQPSAFWQKVAPRMADATAAAGVPMRVWFLSATSIYTTENGTEIGRSSDLPAQGDVAPAPSPDSQGEGEHVTVKVVAIIGVLSASIVFIASLIGLTLWCCIRRRRERQRQRKSSSRGNHAPDCPMHVCTCHRSKARSASPRGLQGGTHSGALQGGTHSGPLPPSMLLHADARPRGSAGSSSAGSPGHRSPASSGGAYGALRVPGTSCGPGCRVHALLDPVPHGGLNPGGGLSNPALLRPDSSGGAAGGMKGTGSNDGRPPRAPSPAISTRGSTSSGGSGGCCCVGAAAVSDGGGPSDGASLSARGGGRAGPDAILATTPAVALEAYDRQSMQA